MDHCKLAGYSILVLAREAAPACELENAGARLVWAETTAQALRRLEEIEISGAVLDCTERIGSNHLLAERRTAFGIPVVFCKDIGRNEAWPHARVVSNPVTGEVLTQTLRHLPSLPRTSPALERI